MTENPNTGDVLQTLPFQLSIRGLEVARAYHVEAQEALCYLVDGAEETSTPKGPYLHIKANITENGHDQSIVLIASQRDGYKGRLGKVVSLQEVLPASDLKQLHIRFPAIIAHSPKTESMVQEYVDMKPVGTNHVAEKTLNYGDVQNLVHLFRSVMEAGEQFADRVNFRHFRISYPFDLVKRDGQYQDKYNHDFFENPQRMNLLRQQLTEEYIAKMEAILRNPETARLFDTTAKRYFVLGNPIPGKIGKDNDGNLVMMYQERCCHTSSPASDYMALFTTLWEFPITQAGLLKTATRINREDIPDFLEYCRLDFIFNRGSGELAYWISERVKPSNSDEYTAYCEKAIDRLTTLMKHAIDNGGIWYPDYHTHKTPEFVIPNHDLPGVDSE